MLLSVRLVAPLGLLLALSTAAACQEAEAPPAPVVPPAAATAATAADDDAARSSTDAPTPSPTPADGGKAGHGSAALRIGYYQNDDGGDDGNPFLDEAETVIEPVIVIDVNVTERLALTATLSYDFVSSASIDRLSQYPEQSGASGDNYFGGDVGLRYQLTEDLRVGAHAGASFEYDYTSFGVGADVAWDLFEKATTLSLGVNAYFDTVDIIRYNGVEEGQDDRTSVTLNLGWYQVLRPTTHMSLGYTLTHQSGFLETAYNGVVLEWPTDPPNPFLEGAPRGVEVAEVLPDTRLRHALFGEVRQYFDTGTSVSLAGRFYTDSWGITSGAGEVRLYQWLIEEVLHVRFRYRLYAQTAADAYEEHVLIPPAQRAAYVASAERTQDADLGAFSSHTVGAKVVWRFGRGWTLDFSADYVLRSDGINQVILAGGIKWDF